ncbi:MAG: hypothetical protein LLG15_08800 [Betaproteobacteria bacterium]|nr:hypothetical protein [Betaproteobacteria bacterium]
MIKTAAKQLAEREGFEPSVRQ